MSPTGVGKRTAATRSHPTRRPTAPRPGADETSPQDRAAEGAPEPDPRSPRRVPSARVVPSRRTDPYAFNDPCNYLG